MIRPFLTALACLAVVLGASDRSRADTVAIVCPQELRSCFSEWIVHREAEGHRFLFVDPSGCEPQLKLLGLANKHQNEEGVTLLFVGDGTRTGVRPKTKPARVIGRYGPETDIVTDSPYADLAGATRVGRLPFNDAAVLRRYLRRVIRRDNSPVTWADARLQIAAGVGGFSPLIDTAIEGAATSVVRRIASPAYTIDLTRYDGSHPNANDLLPASRGGVWVWMGHGLRDRLPGIEAERIGLATRGAEVAVLLACYAGDFSQPNDCVAEQLLKAEDGPLAVVASTRVSMPYGNARLGSELLSNHANASPTTTIGDLVSTARRQSIEETDAPELAGLAPLARLMGPAGHSLRDERLDHCDMYQLLGDPLMRVSRLVPMTIDVPSRLASQQRLTVRGVAPIGGRLCAEVVRPGKSAPLAQADDSPILAGDHFAIQLPLEASWQRGERVVRVGIEGDGRLAIATARVTRSRVESERVATRATLEPPR